jgi:hypothetical protein
VFHADEFQICFVSYFDFRFILLSRTLLFFDGFVCIIIFLSLFTPKSSLVYFPTLPKPTIASGHSKAKYYRSQSELSQCSDTNYSMLVCRNVFFHHFLVFSFLFCSMISRYVNLVDSLIASIATHILPLLSLSPMVSYAASEFYIRLQLSPVSYLHAFYNICICLWFWFVFGFARCLLFIL